MSQPGYRNAPGQTPAPLRVTSERLSDDEARAASTARAAATIAPTGPVPVPPPAPDRPAPDQRMSSSAPVVARPSLPVVAPRPRRRFGELWRLVFARRRAGRHRPETTPPQGWSMFAPQRPPGRRAPRRWGRR
ncbi:hypothetical protein [Actinomycetospora sp. CA-053990]|uniref:hypothetical protein n=1 Tax=Actinomycetospora sp. CA-053990 TaxID=3239891 RepID=UPI003D8BE8A4